MLCIFDLDGTLLNTLQDLCDTGNTILARHHHPTHPLDAYRYFVGDGILKLVERALPESSRDADYVKAIYDEFMTHYQIHKMDKTCPYDGIVGTMEQMQCAGIRLAVASNKPQEAMGELMAHYFPSVRFAAVFGKRAGIPGKPAPDIVFDILRETGESAESTWYVGDTATDMLTATNAGLRKLGVTWGFRTREELQNAHADLIIDKPEELLQLKY